MATKQKRYPRFNFKKVFASLFILVILLITSVIIITDSVKAEYVDESDEIGSHIAWITIYDTDGIVIVNWTSVNDDVEPNVNSQDKGVGYWSIGIYVDESDGGYYLNPCYAINLYLTFTNMTDTLSWYPNQYNFDSYLSSYTDYGTYTIVNYKTPDWETQMTYDWWRLDSELNVNATLYFNYGTIGEVQETAKLGTLSTGTWEECKFYYDSTTTTPSLMYVIAYQPSSYQINRVYYWFENPHADLEVIFDFAGKIGSYNQLYQMIYNSSVMSDSWVNDYYDLSNFNSEPMAIWYNDDFVGDYTWSFIIPESDDYGDYILLVCCQSADYLNLGAIGTDNLGGQYGSLVGYTVPNNYSLAFSFEQSIQIHESFSMDIRSIVWLLIGLLPAVILGYFIGRPGVIAGLAIMALVIGYSQPNYFWVMALTLGICGIMLYKGGVK